MALDSRGMMVEDALQLSKYRTYGMESPGAYVDD